MRAVVVATIGSLDGVTFEEITDPVPSAGEVLIEIHAACVNFADLLTIEGKYQDRPPLPYIAGREASGVVVAVGNEVTRYRPGDRVMAFMRQGAFAERGLASEADCFVIPPDMTFEEAAAMGIVYQTAYFSLVEHGRLGAGETVLITGASGGVGLAAIQLAKAMDAVVLAGLTSPDKAAVVLDNGADGVIDLSQDNLRDALRTQVNAATNGQGADIVLETIGGEVFDASLRTLAWGGRMVIIGFAGGEISSIKANYLLVKNITASGIYWDSYRQRQPERVARAQEAIFDLYNAKRLRPPIMASLPLSAFRQAFAFITDRKVAGRVVLTAR